MDFTTIGNPGNVADTTGRPNPVGAVPYTYYMGKYEVSRDMITKANSLGNLGISLVDMEHHGGNGSDKPATGIHFHEAAKFVNWLNTSSGNQAAYNLDGSGKIQLWGAGQYTESNQFRHKNAYYFLPSVDEWYKAAYGSPSGTWYKHANGSNSAPTKVASGTDNNTAVYDQHSSQGPADITAAGGLSAYGIMGMGGNVREWNEKSSSSLLDEKGVQRGGSWDDEAGKIFEDASEADVSLDVAQPEIGVPIEVALLAAFAITEVALDIKLKRTGLRVASVPEPGSASLVILGLAAVLARRRRSARGVAARR